MQHDRIFLQLDVRLGIFQVEARVDLLQRLLDGVRHLLQVNLAHDVKSVIGHRISILSEMMEYDCEVNRKSLPKAGLSRRNFGFSGFSQFEKIVEIAGSLLPA